MWATYLLNNIFICKPENLKTSKYLKAILSNNVYINNT